MGGEGAGAGGLGVGTTDDEGGPARADDSDGAAGALGTGGGPGTPDAWEGSAAAVGVTVVYCVTMITGGGCKGVDGRPMELGIGATGCGACAEDDDAIWDDTSTDDETGTGEGAGT